MNTAQQIAEIIQSITKEKSISVNRMLQDCNLSKKVIDNMKTGSMPSADKLAIISHYLNVSISYLMGINEEENPYKKMSDNELDKEILKLSNSLSPEAQEKAISYLRYLINEDKK